MLTLLVIYQYNSDLYSDLLKMACKKDPSSRNIREVKQQRRQQQRKRHLKINIWEMATILLLLLLHSIPYF